MQGMGLAAVLPLMAAGVAEGQTAPMTHGPEEVFELRIYTCPEGKLPLLLKRFREKEIHIFARLGMRGIGYWVPTDEPKKSNTLAYLLAHKSRAAAAESWKKFSVDPEWVKLKAESEAAGSLVSVHDVTFMSRTDFSPML